MVASIKGLEEKFSSSENEEDNFSEVSFEEEGLYSTAYPDEEVSSGEDSSSDDEGFVDDSSIYSFEGYLYYLGGIFFEDAKKQIGGLDKESFGDQILLNDPLKLLYRISLFVDLKEKSGDVKWKNFNEFFSVIERIDENLISKNWMKNNSFLAKILFLLKFTLTSNDMLENRGLYFITDELAPLKITLISLKNIKDLQKKLVDLNNVNDLQDLRKNIISLEKYLELLSQLKSKFNNIDDDSVFFNNLSGLKEKTFNLEDEKFKSQALAKLKQKLSCFEILSKKMIHIENNFIILKTKLNGSNWLSELEKRLWLLKNLDLTVDIEMNEKLDEELNFLELLYNIICKLEEKLYISSKDILNAKNFNFLNERFLVKDHHRIDIEKVVLNKIAAIESLDDLDNVTTIVRGVKFPLAGQGVISSYPVYLNIINAIGSCLIKLRNIKGPEVAERSVAEFVVFSEPVLVKAIDIVKEIKLPLTEKSIVSSYTGYLDMINAIGFGLLKLRKIKGSEVAETSMEKFVKFSKQVIASYYQSAPAVRRNSVSSEEPTQSYNSSSDQVRENLIANLYDVSNQLGQKNAGLSKSMNNQHGLSGAQTVKLPAKQEKIRGKVPTFDKT